MEIFEFLNITLIGTCLPPFLLAAGLFFAIRLGFFPFLHPITTLSKLKNGKESGRSSFSALTVALAGTLGVGNITGVGVALSVGGAGAVLWLAVGGLLSAFLKYAEITLALSAGKTARGQGALSYITPTLGRGAARLFAVLTLALALSMGSLLQGQVIADALSTLLPLPRLSIGLALAGVTLLLALGGQRGIFRLLERWIPILTLAYTLGALLVIASNAEALPRVLGDILSGAFSLRSAGGGILGLGCVRALRVGMGRGLFSNEAGAGTAPFAHSEAEVSSPARQGLFGILEVLIDTVLMCPMTALAVLCAFPALPHKTGTALVAAAFGTVFGRAAALLVTAAVAAFAFATVACWLGYGRTAYHHLIGSKTTSFIYFLLFLAALPLGASLPVAGAFGLCDLILGAMALLNTTALFLNHKKIRTLTEEYGLLKKKATIKEGECAKGASRHPPKGVGTCPPIHAHQARALKRKDRP